MPQPAYSKRLNADLHIRAAIRVDRADAGAGRVTSTTREVWLRFLAAVRSLKPGELGKIKSLLTQTLGRLTPALKATIGRSLSADLDWGHRSMAKALTARLPDATLSRVYLRQSQRPRVRESIREAERRRGGPEARVNLLLPSEPTQAQLEDLLFPPPTAARATQILKADVAGKNWEERLDGLSKHIIDKDRLIADLAAGIEQGMTPAELVDVVSPSVGAYDAAARRIARTESLRVSDTVGRDAMDELGDEIKAYRREVTLDDVTGVDHRPLNGKIYPKGEEEDLPSRPNCRCYYTPVFRDEELVQTPDGRLAVQELGGQTVDLGQYSDWFDQQPEQLQKAAVGARKWDAVAAKLGRAPEYADFVGVDGQPLTLQQLRAETADEAEQRKADALAAIRAQAAGLVQVDATTVTRGVQLGVVHRGDDLLPPPAPEPAPPPRPPEIPPAPVVAAVAPPPLPELGDAKPKTLEAAIRNRAILAPQVEAAAASMLAAARSDEERAAIRAATASILGQSDAKFWAYTKATSGRGLLEDSLLGLVRSGAYDIQVRVDASTPGKSFAYANVGGLPAHKGPIPPDDGVRPAVNAEEMLARLKSDPTLDAAVERFKAAVEGASSRVAALLDRRNELERALDDLASRRIKRFEGMDLKEAKRAFSAAIDDYVAAKSQAADRTFDALRALNAGKPTYSIELSGADMADARQAVERLRGVVARPSERVPGESTLRMDVETISGRASQSTGSNGSKIKLDPADSRGGLVAVHEMLHGVEDQSPGVLAASEVFLRHRTAGQPVVKIADLAPGQGFRDDERGIEDGFGKTGVDRKAAAYMGKIYTKTGSGDDAPVYASEILTMGVENLARNPEAFIKDEEYARYLIGVLTGRLQIIPGAYQW